MLSNIDSNSSPELLYCLAQMGHGDDLVIDDRNFSAASTALHTCFQKVIPMSAFQERVRRAYSVVCTSGDIPYGCYILCKGLIFQSCLAQACLDITNIDRYDLIGCALHLCQDQKRLGAMWRLNLLFQQIAAMQSAVQMPRALDRNAMNSSVTMPDRIRSAFIPFTRL